MPHYFIGYQKDGNGWAPPIPHGIGFLLLAGPGVDPPWGLFTVEADLPASAHVRTISDELEHLIRSAERFPPALAIARDLVTAEFDSASPTHEEFSARYVTLLLQQLRDQANAPYLLTKAVGSELGYLIPGEFYWVLRYLRGSSAVAWVSADYFVYQNPVTDFDLSPEQLERLLMPHAVSAI